MDMSGLGNLFQNKLFLQYLSSAGGAMSAGQPVGPALDQITQQNIGAQSQAQLSKRYLDMLSKMLSGEEVPTGGKVTHDEKGTKLEIPKGSQMGGASTNAATGGGYPSMDQVVDFQPTNMGQVENINPFR